MCVFCPNCVAIPAHVTPSPGRDRLASSSGAPGPIVRFWLKAFTQTSQTPCGVEAPWNWEGDRTEAGWDSESSCSDGWDPFAAAFRVCVCVELQLKTSWWCWIWFWRVQSPSSTCSFTLFDSVVFILFASTSLSLSLCLSVRFPLNSNTEPASAQNRAR